MLKQRLLHELKDLLIIVLVLLTIFVVAVSFINVYVVSAAWNNMTDIDGLYGVTGYKNIVVTDSGIWSKNSAEAMLTDRIDTADQVFLHDKNSQVYILIGSEKNSDLYKDILTAQALKSDIPEEQIIFETASDNLLDTMYHAKHEHEMDTTIIVSQRISLYRMVYAAQIMEIEVIGIKTPAADVRWGADVWNNLREFFKRARDFTRVTLFGPEPR